MTFGWESTDAGVVRAFDRKMIDWLRNELTGYLRMLDSRIGQYRYYDPLCDQLGIPLPTEPIEHRLLNVYFGEWCPPDRDPALRYWQEADLFTAMRTDAEIVLLSLPEDGETVELSDNRQVLAWWWVLINLRIAHAVHANLTELIRAPEDTLPMSEMDANSSRDRSRYCMWWLSKVADGLKAASGQPLPELAFR